MSDEGQGQHVEHLLEYLRSSRGIDLSGYKRATLLRRITRRMQQVNVGSIGDYLDHLEVHPEEFGQLFNTLLINVTSFFRDPDAWNVLEREIMPALVASKRDGEAIRVWSAGCASGEEAFTLAMLWAERLGETDYRQRVKIYATDLDEDALARGRQATYEAREVEPVPPRLLERYFDKAQDRYTARAELRRGVIFGRHDLIDDAPISHIDLLVCRNTLIYLNAEAQGRILARFHFALNEGGFLFLGMSEMPVTHANLFHPVDAPHRVFSKAPQTELHARLLTLAQTGDSRAATRLAQGVRITDEAFSAMPVAQIVVDGEGTLVLANQFARRMFGLTGREVGTPFQDLEISYRPLELRSLIQRAHEERSAMRVSGVERALPGGQTQFINVEVTPLQDPDGAVLGVSVVFDDQTTARQMQAELQRTSQELETAYEELQSTNEELETTNEELQSTVEELETTNEELQSTNEEHETMNEELQATNEELQTINEQLRGRTDELNHANALLEMILASLSASAIVVDRGLKVLIWNSRSEQLWGVRADEARGLPLIDLDIGLPVTKLLEPLHACLNGSAAAPELSVDGTDRRGRSVQCRVRITPLVSGEEIYGAIMVIEDRS